MRLLRGGLNCDGLSNWSIRRQLVLVALIPVLLLGALALFVTSLALNKISLDLVLERNTALARMASNALNENLIGYRRPLLVCADSLIPWAGDSAEQSRYLAELDPFLRQFEGGVILLDAGGIAIASTPGHGERVGLDYSFREYFQRVKANREPVFSTVIQESPSGRDAVVIAVPVEQNGYLMGALVGVSFLDQQPWVDALQPLRVSREGIVSLIDVAGTVIYHPNVDLIGQNYFQYPGLQNLTGGTTSSQLLDSFWRDQRVVLSYASLPDIGWTLVLEEPWKPIIAPTVPYQWGAAVLLAVGIVLSVIALLISINRTTRPLASLVEEARRVASGLDFRPLKATGAPELRTLLSAFNQMVIRLAEQRTALYHYATRVLQGQEQERKRISRDLHDETVQDLVGIIQRIELYRVARERAPDELNDRLLEIEHLAKGTLADVRRISNDLRPASLEDLGLSSALHFLCDQLDESIPSLYAHCEIVGTERRLDPELELTVFRIVQEALNNVRKHASRATRVNVTLFFERWGIQTTIEDDGPGFVLGNIQALFRNGHLGLAGMTERAQLFGGVLNVSSSPGKGTTINLYLPDRDDGSGETAGLGVTTR